MASAFPFFGSNSCNKPWVDQISQTLQTQLAITIETPPVSIFEVTETRKAEKPEAYVPRRIGLGPDHHFRPKLYQKMEQNKISAVKRVLKPHQIHGIRDVVKRIRDVVPVIRPCYEFYLDADDDMLAWVFAIDGLFLIDQLGSYADHKSGIEAKDLVMLENQIPLIVLNEIVVAISVENPNVQEHYLESKIRVFCESESPFVLSNERIDIGRVRHLIDCMYRFIVNNETSPIPRKLTFENPETDASKNDPKGELLEAVIKIAGLIPIAHPLLQIIDFVKQKFPRIAEKEPMVEEIKVPSVSKLRKHAGVKFRLSPENGGIRNIKFVFENPQSVYLPLINLNLDSETVLRNLVAYEQLMSTNTFTVGYGLELTEYVDFMCGIIDTPHDGKLEEEEVVKLFNGISRSRGKMINGQSELWKTVARLNQLYESMPMVSVKRLAQKQVLVSAKVLTFLAAVLSVLIMFRDMYWNAYGSMFLRFLRSKLSLILR